MVQCCIVSDENVSRMKTKVSNFCDNFSLYDDFDLHHKSEYFCNALNIFYNECFPKKRKRITMKRYKCPWLSSAILRCINTKHKLYRDMRAGRVQPSQYRQYRNITCSMINRAKDSFYIDKFNSCMGDIVRTWKCINSVVKESSTGKQSKFIIEHDNLLVTDDLAVSNLFNTYFASIGKTISDSIPDTVVDPLQFVERNSNSLFLTPTHRLEIISIVNSFKNKPCNIDSIPNSIYKSLVEDFAGIISNLINVSFLNGEFPTIFKTARVIALHKKGNKNIMSNYRPISTINTIGKIFEKAMYERLMSFAERYELISKNQYGFRRNLSTTDSLLNFTNNIHNSLNSKGSTIGVSLDYKKAFDSIHHQILLNKLYKLGIRGTALDWFKSYLTDRKQYVVVNGKSSSISNVPTGCPQGSILSSILFLLYIDDMYKCTPYLKFTHYADDTLVYYTHDSIPSLVNIINSGLSDISIWLKTNKLLLNSEKSNYILFSNKKIIPNIRIAIDDHPIDRVKSTTFLGIVIDEKLNFADHIQATIKKMSRAAGIMYKLNTIVPKPSLKCLYSSLVYPHLTYGVEVWGGSSTSTLSRVKSLQSKCVGMLSGPNSYIGDTYKQNTLMTFSNIHKYFTLIKFHKYIRNNNNSVVANLIHSQIDHNHNTRFIRNQNLTLPPINLSKFYSSFLYQGVMFYNQLPVNIKNLNVGPFKNYLRTSLV